MIDFSWFYFIGKTKLLLSFKETGRLTVKKFNNLFSHYKNMFDLEMQLKAANMTYRKYYSKIQKQDEWF